MSYDVIVVGGGAAGLTAAAYLSKSGASILLCEKEDKVGGLVNSFERDGFVFDGGARAIENSGIVLPMLRQLGMEIEMLKSPVSIGIGSEVLRLSSKDSLGDYQALLERQFPESRGDIGRIIGELRRVMGYMDVLYGIDNPLFLDLKSDPGYVFKTILPWMLKYALTMPKVAKLGAPIDAFLASLSGNRALIDIIDQHFFKGTPAFFALSYFSLYLDYLYPKGGTGSLVGKLEDFILAKGGEIRRGTRVTGVDPGTRTLLDSRGESHSWKTLLWAADQKALYRSLDLSSLRDAKAKKRIEEKRASIENLKGGDSVFTLYLSLDIDPSYFADRCGPHFFCTPSRLGLSSVPIQEIRDHAPKAGEGGAPFSIDKSRILGWTRRHLERTTFEVSCPALRDASLAPAGKTGIIVSYLLDHSLLRHVSRMGWEDEYRDLCRDTIIDVLDGGVFPGLKTAVIDSSTSTPLSIERMTGNADGAITGWAFTNPVMPAVHNLPAVAKSVLTPIPGVWQAGMWTFSPSGLPVSMMTGKLAADAVAKALGALRGAAMGPHRSRAK